MKNLTTLNVTEGSSNPLSSFAPSLQTLSMGSLPGGYDTSCGLLLNFECNLQTLKQRYDQCRVMSCHFVCSGSAACVHIIHHSETVDGEPTTPCRHLHSYLQRDSNAV